MKKQFITTLLSICFIAFAFQTSQAQIRVQPASGISTSPAQYVLGSIKGAVYIKKTALPPGQNINQVAYALKQGLKAVEYLPQNQGFFSQHSIDQDHVKVFGNQAVVNVKTTADSYIVEYVIEKLPIMKPMTVRAVGSSIKNLSFMLDPHLKNFPVAYLTSCDNTFECFNFNGYYLAPPK
ncbi:MAG: hypothetical protein R2824_29260 [Saprospiraceae bacterium]